MLPFEERINCKSKLNECLKEETAFYPISRGPLKYLELLGEFTEHAILYKHTYLLRQTEYYMNSGKKFRYLFFKILLRRLQHKYALRIPCNVCAKGLHIMHVGSILINDKSVIKENCTFHINTSVVAGGTNHFAPTLEQGVVIGVGAVILGNVHIAKNVAIGANAVVNKDVLEPNITVAGIPAKKISNHGSSCWGKGANNGTA